MTYEEALAYLHGLQRFGMKPGLARTEELLRRVGRPDRRCGRVAHLTGTSGKGSVAALVEACLRGAGHRVGLYTSPSLERFTDRIQVNRQEIPPGEFAALVAELRPQVEAMVADGLEQPTEFEVLTTAAFLYFARSELDWLVLEAGLGGRFDATTVVEEPVVTCISNIGLDHTEWLGDTHEKIAWDKAGIIKPAVPCVTGTDHAGALEVIRQVAVENHSVLMEVGSGGHGVREFGPKGQVVDLLGARGWYRGVRLNLLGRHQAANAAVALRVLEVAGVREEQIRAGFAAVEWPGRFEILGMPGGATVVLDAAHNPAKCEALAEAVREYFPARRAVLVIGMLADKHVEAMLKPLLPLGDRVLTVTPDSPRGLSGGALAEAADALGHQAEAVSDIEAALEAAMEAPGILVVVTGSFYTVGPARRALRKRMGRD